MLASISLKCDSLSSRSYLDSAYLYAALVAFRPRGLSWIVYRSIYFLLLGGLGCAYEMRTFTFLSSLKAEFLKFSIFCMAASKRAS